MTRRERRLKALKRRSAHLEQRITDYKGKSRSFDEAEKSAIDYAIGIIEAAEVNKSIEELETIADGLGQHSEEAKH